MICDKKLLIFSFIFIMSIALITSIIINDTLNSKEGRKWYNSIKSDITPNGIVFSIAWGILYIILAICLTEILCMKDKRSNYLSILYIINLLLTVLWSYIFFNKRNIYLAKIIMSIILLTSIIIYTYYNNKLYLLYVLWISYAFIL